LFTVDFKTERLNNHIPDEYNVLQPVNLKQMTVYIEVPLTEMKTRDIPWGAEAASA